MSHIDISRRFMIALSHLEKRDFGPIDSAALAACVVASQQDAVTLAHALGYLNDAQRDDLMERLADSMNSPTEQRL